jgi:pimeloyl-ACP methyl ester carboxylesterase
VGGILFAGLWIRTAPAGQTPVPPAPHLPTLFGRPFFRRVVLSPRARSLAFVVPSRHHRRRVVEVLALGSLHGSGGMHLEASKTFPRGVRVVGLRWVSPHLLFVVTRRPSSRNTIGFGLLDDRRHAHAYRPLRLVMGSHNGPLSRASVVALSPLGPVVLWRSAPLARPVIYRYDLAMGQARLLCRVPLPGAHVLVDRRGWPRLAVTPHRVSAPSVLVGRGHCTSWVPVTSRFGPSDLRFYDRFLTLGPHGRGVYFLAPSPTTTRTLGLYRFGLVHFTRTLLVASPRSNVYESRRGRWSSFVWGRHRRRLIGVDFMPGRPRVLWVHPHDPLARLLRGLGRELNGEVVRVRGAGPHGRILLLETLGDRNPGRYYLYASRPTPSLRFLMARHPALHEGAMVALRPVLIPEGTFVLHAYLARPPKPGPLVVLVHGGGYGRRFVWFYDPLIQGLARAGYTVLAVNTRGSGGYGTLYEGAAFHDWGGVVSDDLAAAARWALRRGLAPGGSLAVLGRGVGGEAALLAAAAHPTLFHAVVSIDMEDGPVARTTQASSAHVPGVSPARLLHAALEPSVRHLPVLFVRLSGHRKEGNLALRLKRAGRAVTIDLVPRKERTGPRWAAALHDVLAFLKAHLGVPLKASVGGT